MVNLINSYLRTNSKVDNYPTLHGSLSSVMVPGSEAETELEAHGTSQKRVRIAIPKKKQVLEA